jgi:hypothetical protein
MSTTPDDIFLALGGVKFAQVACVKETRVVGVPEAPGVHFLFAATRATRIRRLTVTVDKAAKKESFIMSFMDGGFRMLRHFYGIQRSDLERVFRETTHIELPI